MRSIFITEQEKVYKPLGTVYTRTKFMRPTEGSQRRCYDGCFHPDDWEIVWGEWKPLSLNVPKEKLNFWRDLNAYSISVGGADNTDYKWEPS